MSPRHCLLGVLLVANMQALALGTHNTRGRMASANVVYTTLEHPASAFSWLLAKTKQLPNTDEMKCVRVGFCMFHDTKKLPTKKPSKLMKMRLGSRCWVKSVTSNINLHRISVGLGPEKLRDIP